MFKPFIIYELPCDFEMCFSQPSGNLSSDILVFYEMLKKKRKQNSVKKEFYFSLRNNFLVLESTLYQRKIILHSSYCIIALSAVYAYFILKFFFEKPLLTFRRGIEF